MSEAIAFENLLDDLITEHFSSKKTLLEAIRYFGDSTIAEKLREALTYFEEADDAD